MTDVKNFEPSLNPAPFMYENEVLQKGLQYERPPMTFKNLDWEGLAKERLSANSFGYVAGSAGTAETNEKNRAAFKKWSIVPSRLVKADFPDLHVDLFGERYQFPIALAPVGVQRIFNPDGEVASAKAAAANGIVYTCSTAGSTSIEDVAKANGNGKRWYQLYWPKNEQNDITASLLSRAKAAGYNVLLVTLDTYILGWRPSDMDNGYNPFLRPDNIGVEIGFTDPVYRKHFEDKHGKTVDEDLATAAGEWASTVLPAKSHCWEDIKFLQENWDGPIVLKGIQTVADAKAAVEAGVQGIVVSNHGGRQQDGGAASLTMLPKIAEAVGDKIEIIFDSGIRCGADIVKALALGAKMVLIGRPYIYGLALGGESGVSHVIRSLLGDLDLTLHLSGIPSVDKKDLNVERLLYEEYP
ncbi:FMN dependent dehydrogenase [Aulographum hederae CBS 113979]|uniref:FMN dependent dehydrogenase n=1 Tax=Aulographum hederae CBS 113979 TaxID=1176131 RepID=A0A6G1HB16_9PEZI|nr:FMN dependent dehydrogenase [Aulographum hederae CBS 113979]